MELWLPCLNRNPDGIKYSVSCVITTDLAGENKYQINCKCRVIIPARIKRIPVLPIQLQYITRRKNDESVLLAHIFKKGGIRRGPDLAAAMMFPKLMYKRV